MSKPLLIAALSVLGVVAGYGLPAYAERTDAAAKIEHEQMLDVAANGCMTCKTDAEYFASEEYRQAKYANEMLAKFRQEIKQ